MMATCDVIKIRRLDIQREKWLAEVRENKFLSLIHSWGRKVWASCCFMIGRSGVAWFRLGTFQLSGARGAQRGADAPCALRRVNPIEFQVLLKCSEKQM
jgi:hypothetical protein